MVVGIEEGFVHARSADRPGVQRLPANARGVLYVLPPTPPDYVVDGTGHISGRVISRLPGSAHFSIVDTDTDRALPATVTRVPLRALLDRPETVYLAQTTRQKTCIEKPGTCPKAELDWTAMAAHGELHDISGEQLTTSRMLRVAPKGGFIPGHHYMVRSKSAHPGPGEPGYTRHADAKGVKWQSMYPTIIRVFVDRQAFPGWDDRPSLDTAASDDGTLRVGWDFPASLAPWQDSIATYTKLTPTQEPEYVLACGPDITDLVTEDNPADRGAVVRDDGICREASGIAAFLEVGDVTATPSPARLFCDQHQVRH
ncbi:MAG: hypothetical protein ABW163_09505 [Luteimonas sp.]